MKTLLKTPLRSVLALMMMAAMVATVRANETKEQKIPPGQLKKYDLNKDGVLDESEKAAWLADKKGLAEKEEGKKADKGAKKAESEMKDVKKTEKDMPKTEEAKKAKAEAKKAAAEAKRLEKFDANKDGKLDETELAAEAAAKAKKKKAE